MSARRIVPDDLEIGERIAARLLASDPDHWTPILMPDGTARQSQWHAEDGWIIVYTTERVDGGPWAGRFVTMAYKPLGKGARSGRGKADRWTRVYARPFTQRKAAKARALALYREHSPRWAARHPERPTSAHDWHRAPDGERCRRCWRARDIDHDDPQPCPGEINPADPIPGGHP